MNPLFDLVHEPQEAPTVPVKKNVDKQNAQSYDALGQMMRGVQRKR